MSRKLVWWTFLFFLALYLLSRGEGFYSTDGETMLRLTWAIVDKGRLSIPCTEDLPSAIRGPDGKCYSRYGLGQPLAAIPFYLLGKGIAALWPGADYGAVIRFCVSLFNQLVTALTCALMALFGSRLYRSQAMGLGLAVAYGLGTMAWPYAKFYFSEPLTTLCLLTAVYGLYRQKEQPGPGWLLAAGGAFGYALLTRLSSLIVLPLLVGYLLYVRRAKVIRALALFLTPATLFLAVNFLYSYLAFGGPLASYAGESWSTPFLVGLYGLLFSPGKSLFLFVPLTLFSPLALVRLFKADYKGEAVLFACTVLAYLLFHAGWWTWHGGWSWGPRFLVPVLPFLILPLGVLWSEGTRTRWALIVLGALGVAVQLLAVLIDFNQHMLLVNDEHKILFVARYSPLIGHLRLILEGWSLDLSVFNLPRAWSLICLLALALSAFVLWRIFSQGQPMTSTPPT
jgi:4-amino-4-deoxy-L-arabinose transferase-like glycosyltransferase